MTKEGAKAAQRAAVEQIVREVLTQMATPGQTPKAVKAVGELVLTNKVISLGEVESRLSGVARLVVPHGAVFTPAARDELRKHNVAIASAVPAASSAANQHLVVGAAEAEYEPAVLLKALAIDGVKIEWVQQVGLIGVVDELCAQVIKGGRFGLLITGRTAVAVCLANRQHGVRAALANSTQSVSEAVMTMAANLLVLNPKGNSVFEIRQMVQIVMQGSRHDCPPALRDRLG